MIYNRVEQWIDGTLLKHHHLRKSCAVLATHFEGFYPGDFLSNSYFVVMDKLPKPDMPELNDLGIGSFLEMDADGITYKDTYFIKPHLADDIALHFHELVHAAQWQHLGAPAFIERYIKEYNADAYEEAPLEKMAYSLERYFKENRSRPIDVLQYVRENLHRTA